MEPETMDGMERGVRRVRHEGARMRMLEVRKVERITPGFVRITLGGEDLKGYLSASYDDHSKIFFPAPGQEKPATPIRRGPDGPEYAEGVVKPAARDYTPRKYDAERNELWIEFALHGEGPATEWAAQAKPGQFLAVGGPRGSFVVEGKFDWYLLVGDESALPAIARRLEELHTDAKVIVVAEVANRDEERQFTAPADTTVYWIHRDAGTALLEGVISLSFPEGEPYVWVACEGTDAKEIRRHLIEDRKLNKKWVKASGYWRRGAVAVHDHLDD